MDAFLGVKIKAKQQDAAQNAETHATVPWVEKYRPKKVSDICYQDEVVHVMQAVLRGGDLPHMLLYGPPGTGKTSAAVALARELFGKYYKDRVLELNSSDERGIQIVRSRIKDFARRAVGNQQRVVNGEAVSMTHLKIVILDEADAMTPAAQSAMRRVMEMHSATTRFFLICNYVSRIISPLISRCAKFRFKPLPAESQIERLRFICEQERLIFEEPALLELIEWCEGDLRKSITTLQTVSRGSRKITTEVVRNMEARIPDQEVRKLLDSCKQSHFGDVIDVVEQLRRKAFTNTQLLSQITDAVLEDEFLEDIQKANILEKIAISEGRLADRGDGYLNVLDVVATVYKNYNSLP